MMSSMHFYGWKLGLKTGMYYLRSKPAVNAIKFTVDVETMNKLKEDTNEKKEITKKEVVSDPLVCKWRPANLRDTDECL